MAVDLAELAISVRSDGVVVANRELQKMERQAGKAESATQKLAKQVDRMGKSMRRVGGVMSARVTLPILAAGAATVKFASDFEDSFADIRKTVDATEPQFARLSSEIRQMSREVPTAVEELNRLAGVAGQLGVEQDNLISFTRTIAMLGDASDIAGEEAALSLSRFMNVMGTAQSDIDRVGATIVGLGNNFAAMESEIVHTATSMAAFGNQMGLTEAQVLAYATAIAASGGQTEAASTAFQKTAALMQRAAIEMNEDLQVFARTAGVSAEQFATAFQEDASSAILMFLEGLKNISDQGQSTAATLDELGLADQRLQREFGKLLGNLGQLEEAIGLAGDEWERNTALTEEAQKRYQTFNSQMRIFWNTVKDVAITLGNDLIPVVRSSTDFIEGFLEAFQETTPDTRRLVIVIGGLAAAIGPALILIGLMAQGLAAVAIAADSANGALGRFIATLRPLTAVIAGVGTAIGLIAIAIERKYTPGMEQVELSAQVFNVVARAVVILRETLLALGETMLGVVVTVVGGLRQIVSPIEGSIRAMADATENLLEGKVIAAAKSMAGVGDDIAEAYKKGQKQVDEGLGFIAESLTSRVQTAIDEVSALQNSLLETGSAASESSAGMGLFSDSIQIMLATARAYIQAMEEQGGGTEKARESSAEWRQELDLLEAELSGPLAKANVEFEQAIEAINKRFADGEGTVEQWARAVILARNALEQARKDAVDSADGLGGFFGIDAALEGMDLIEERMNEIADIEFDFDNLMNSFHPVAQDMERLGNDIAKINDQIENGQLSEMAGMFTKTGVAASAAFGAIMSGMDRSSKEYQQMAVAQEVVNTALGIAAILQQGQGDPYTAWARMAAMAAMVASMGVNIAGIVGGGGGEAQRRQEMQGTGTVLGDAEAKSESIANAIEITADATSELVGINRSMLRALQSLQEGISGASGMIARGVANVDFSGIELGQTIWEDLFSAFDPLGFAIDSFIGGLFGFGDTEVVDQGIALLGGAITDMTEGAIAQAFGEVERSSLFGNKSKTVFEDLDEAFNDQLNLIFSSMIETVRSAGEALGIPLDEIQSRIDQFEVEAQLISLMDLSAEEQQAELEAVFSAIFDDLATAVIPFIGQFQRVGEGMGETLVRVATSVQVMEEAINQLGLAVDQSDPETFAQISVGLVEMAGGIEEFVSQMQSFVENFASDEQQLRILQESLTSAFDQVGLALPRTREEMWKLMQSLDASTESGREQIAMLLELSDMTDAFYSAIEDATRDYADTVQGLEEALVLDGLSDFQREMVGIQRELMQTIDAMNSAARAAGLQGAREEDLARAHELAAIRAQQAIARLESQAEEWVSELFGTSLSEITAQVNEAQAAFENLQSQLQQLSDFADSLLIGQFSPLPSGERLAEAMAQLEAASASGDVSGVQSIAQTVLQIARDRFASGQQFTDIFNQVQDIIRGTDPADSVQGVSIISAPGLAPLLRQQSQLEQEAEDRREQLLANDIAQAVADLAHATGDSFEDVANRLGFDLQDLGEVLGLNERELADFIESLQVDTGGIATHLETLGDRIVRAITEDLPRVLSGEELTDPIDERSVDSRTGGQAGDIDDRDSDSRTGGQADIGEIRESTDGTTRAVEDASRDISERMATPEERQEHLALLRRIAEASEQRTGGRNIRTRSVA